MGKVKTLPPDGLGQGGKALWAKIVGKYTLRPDELVTLEDVCRTTDMIAALDAAWTDEGRPPMTKGSMGQPIVHPLIGEIRTQRAARNALWRQLKLPDLDEAAGADTVTPNQHRAAAQSKWAAAHGKAG